MQKIRVAQVITRLDWGGSPDIYRILASHLDSKIYDVTLIIGRTDHPTQKTQDFLMRFNGRVITVPTLRREIDIVSDTRALLSLISIFKKERFDVVHTHTAKAGALGRLAARLTGVHAIVHTPHGHNFYGYFNKKVTDRIVTIERFLTRYTDRIIALTKLEKNDYIHYTVAPEEKISVIYQGLELDRYLTDWKEKTALRKAFAVGPDDKVVGMLGRLESVKGPDHFIETAAIVLKKMTNAKFMLVGEGSLRNNLEEKAEKLGIGEKVIFTGWREDIPEMLSLMDLVVLPSLNEAVGMALIEAQAAGVPVVATKVGGISEVVKDGLTGILVEPANPEKMADAILGLLSDGEWMRQMGSAGKAWVRNRFRAEDMAVKTSDLYMEILHKKRYFI